MGYAEADPTLDVGGGDARSKLKILIKLAFGVNVPEDDIPCAGITEIKSIDFAYARLMKVPSHRTHPYGSCPAFFFFFFLSVNSDGIHFPLCVRDKVPSKRAW